MKQREKVNRKPVSGSSRKPSVKRVKEIQTVFEQLGIGDEDSRRRILQAIAPASEPKVLYRIILSGSTLPY